jgi:polysaccharide deacetylase family protein (PEP-CTERM system associated)
VQGIVNALTVDVEDYFQVSALAPAIPRDSWSDREYRVEDNTDRVLAALADHGVHGTFFVLGWIAEKSPGLVRRIAAAGHEIASHGYSHELIYSQSPSEFRTETAVSKNRLEDIIGARVTGYRAASFSITERSLWALDVLIDLGFEYDSSVFPIRHDRYGIPGASRDPGPISAPSGRTIVEFPMAAAEYFGMQLPVSGGGYFRIFPYWLTRAGLRRIHAQRGQPFVFYMHPWEVDPGPPRIDAGFVSRFRHYTNLDKCEARLRRLLQDFRFAPMRTVLLDRELLDAAGRVPTVHEAPPLGAPYSGPERRRVAGAV